NIVSRGEFANNFFIYFARILGSPIYFFLGNALIQLILISKTLSKYSENYWISMIFYITFPLFFLNSFSVVRMFTAISITFFGYKYIVERKPIRYFILIILAAGFHMTALLAIIFYPLSLIKVKRLTIILVLFLGTFTLSFANLIVTKYFPVYLVYLNKSGVQEGTKAIYVFLLIGLFILIYFDRFIKNDFSAMFYLFGLLIYIAFLGYGTVSHRLSLYGT
ncbi:EpsG family protein, partial [Enterococcus faecium]|nr:EpsG family protein [Enterococcus faecium]